MNLDTDEIIHGLILNSASLAKLNPLEVAERLKTLPAPHSMLVVGELSDGLKSRLIEAGLRQGRELVAHLVLDGKPLTSYPLPISTWEPDSLEA